MTFLSRWLNILTLAILFWLEELVTGGKCWIHADSNRWHRKVLKTTDPSIVSVGWRRYQATPASIEVHNGRHCMLKYTPEHMHCLAMFWGPLVLLPTLEWLLCRRCQTIRHHLGLQPLLL